MKVVLTKDVKGTGKRGDIVEVKDGYARNYLLPRNLCVLATAKNINDAKKRREADEHRDELEREKAEQLAGELQGQTFVIPAKAGEGGRLFGAITNREIGEAVKEKFGIELDKKRIVLPEHIKRIGSYEVELKPYANVSCTVTVEVVAQDS